MDNLSAQMTEDNKIFSLPASSNWAGAEGSQKVAEFTLDPGNQPTIGPRTGTEGYMFTFALDTASTQIGWRLANPGPYADGRFGRNDWDVLAADGVFAMASDGDTHPGYARAPNPLDDTAGVLSDVILSWIAASGATAHDVYFGADELAVANATTASAQYKGRQPGTSFDPVNPGDGADDLLTGFVTYYWRIDEVEGATVTKGDVWSFTTVPSKASAIPVSARP